MDILISGRLLGCTYALIAMGLNLQYGLARIMKLANGAILVVGGFVAFCAWTGGQVSPFVTIFVLAPWPSRRTD